MSYLADPRIVASAGSAIVAIEWWPPSGEGPWRDQVCPPDQPGRCGTISFAPSENAGLTRPIPMKEKWAKLFSGDDDVFGLVASQPAHLDRIRLNGDVTRITPASGLFLQGNLAVLDLGEHVAAVMSTPWGYTPTTITAIPAYGPKPGDEMAGYELPIVVERADVPRQMTSWGPHPEYHFAFPGAVYVAGHAAAGGRDGTLYAAWYEMPKGPQKVPGKPIAFPGNVKELKLARFTIQGKELAIRTIARTTVAWDQAPKIELRSRLGAIDLNDATFDEKLHPTKQKADFPFLSTTKLDQSPPWRGPIPERPVAGGYDSFRGEGVALLHDDRSFRVVRFDAFGAPLGPPMKLDTAEGPRPVRAFHVNDTWMFATESTDAAQLQFVTGPDAGTSILPPAAEPNAKYATTVFERADGHLAFARFGPLEANGDSKAPSMATSEIDFAAKKAAPWVDHPIPESFAKVTAVLAAAHGAPGEMTWIARRDDGSLIAIRGLPGEPMTALDNPLFGPGSLRASASIHDLFDAEVARVSVVAEDHVTWLSSGLALPVTPLPSVGRLEPRMVPGPFLAGGLLSARAESPEPLDPSVSALLSRCDFAFSTGPRRVVLLCSEPVLDDGPSLRATSHVVRW